MTIDEYERNLLSMEEFEEVAPPVRSKPCNECPFLRTSLPGHLGHLTAAEWAEMAHGEGPMACHLTTNPASSWVGTMQCAGMAQFRRNIFKSPRDPLIAVAPERDTVTVFAWDNEMIAHHERRVP